MRLEKIRGRMPLQKATGSKYRIRVKLVFESDCEKATVYRKAGLNASTSAEVHSAVYLDLDDKIMQEPFVTLIGKESGKRFEINVPTSRRWKGAVPAVREYLEHHKTIFGY